MRWMTDAAEDLNIIGIHNWIAFPRIKVSWLSIAYKAKTYSDRERRRLPITQ